jgi:hypothetical protein
LIDGKVQQGNLLNWMLVHDDPDVSNAIFAIHLKAVQWMAMDASNMKMNGR